MARVLVIEKDLAMRELLCGHLKSSYEVLEAGKISDAFTLAAHAKPDAILLDLNLPGSSGFEVCRTLANLCVSRPTPIFVITEQKAETFQDFCLGLGAVDFFEKPLNFERLKERLDAVLSERRVDRRAHVRVRLVVPLKLRGKDANGEEFSILTSTDDLSPMGFLCSCPVEMEPGAIVDVYLTTTGGSHVGRARAVHSAWRLGPWNRFGFQFVERPRHWALQLEPQGEMAASR